MRIKWFCCLSFFVVSSVLLGACDAPPTTTVAPPPPTAAPATDAPAPAQTGDAIFQVIKADGTAVDFTLDDLKALPLTSIMSEGNPQEGPALLDVLKAAGVTDFSEVTLTGTDGSYTFKQADLTPNVVLDFNNRGSVKLASPTLTRDQRIRDIFKIEVKAIQD